MPPASSDTLLESAYERVLAAPADAQAHMDLARLLSNRGKLRRARRHARNAAELVSAEFPQLQRLGRLLFQLGAFSQAQSVLELARQKEQLTPRSVRLLATVLFRAGEVSKARECMAQLARIEPLSVPRQIDPDKPNVMRIRSYEQSRFGTRTGRSSGLRMARLKGGHFAVRDLLDSSRINLYVGSVFGDSMLNINNFPAIDVFLNCVSCPDQDPGGLRNVAALLARHPNVPVINHPEKVLLTDRANNAKRLGVLTDVIFPRTEVFANRDTPAAVAEAILAAGFSMPFILRQRGTQTGKTMARIESAESLHTWLAAQPEGVEIHAIEELNAKWDDGFYHKTRAFFIDGTFYPVANLANDDWQIHSGDRYRVMSTTPSTQEDEQRYLNDPVSYLGDRAYRALHAVSDTVGLDFFGIDFTLAPDGKLIVFEANAAMRHNFDHADNFPYTRPHLERISNAFADMVDRRSKRS